jgi:hypothetical protein
MAQQQKVHRLSVSFSDPIYVALEQLAAEKGVSMSDVLRDAIALEKWFTETQKQGGRILLERDGQVRELVRT